MPTGPASGRPDDRLRIEPGISGSKNLFPSLRANGWRERAPDDRLREAIHLPARQVWIASSLSLLAMTNSTRLILPGGQITSDFTKWSQAPFAKIFLFSPDPNQFTDSHCLVPTRGAYRDRHERGAGCGRCGQCA